MDKERDRLDDLAGEVFTVADLLSYQDGAIVSRTLLDTEAATVTVFALDEEQIITCKI